MATHSSVLTLAIPWTEEPGGVQSTGSQRVGHHLATKQQQQILKAQEGTRGVSEVGTMRGVPVEQGARL